MNMKKSPPKRSKAPNLIAAWPQVRGCIAAATRLLVGLDFDGTLSPIVQHYGDARLPEETKVLLDRLAKRPGVEVAIVSGRALEDLTARAGLKGITYIATHGFDMERRGKVWRHPRAGEFKSMIARVAKTLERELAPFAGVYVEPKGYTVAVHYRKAASAKVVAGMRSAFWRVVQPLVDTGEIRVTYGKRILEVRPNEVWGKGHGIAVLLAGAKADLRKIVSATGAFTGDAKGVLPIYIGDDETDEDGFKAVRRIGITARVGSTRKPSSATYRLASLAEVRRFLELLEKTK
jgi:trehalose-phosphatase